jgi:hypothetical protein
MVSETWRRCNEAINLLPNTSDISNDTITDMAALKLMY